MDEPPRRPLTLLGLELSTITLLAVMLWPFGRNMIGLGWLAAVPLLALGVSRLRIRAARWLLTLFHLFCLGFLLLLIGGNPLSLGDVPASTRIVVALGLAQLLLLWMPDTSGWLSAGRRHGWEVRLR